MDGVTDLIALQSNYSIIIVGAERGGKEEYET